MSLLPELDVVIARIGYIFVFIYILKNSVSVTAVSRLVSIFSIHYSMTLPHTQISPFPYKFMCYTQPRVLHECEGNVNQYVFTIKHSNPKWVNNFIIKFKSFHQPSYSKSEILCSIMLNVLCLTYV